MRTGPTPTPPPACIATAWIAMVWLAAATASTPALAQEAISTAPNGADGGAPPAPASESTLRLSDHFARGPEFLGPRGPCGGAVKTDDGKTEDGEAGDGKTDRAPHGEVWAGAGSRGYREAGGVVCVPLSDKTRVTIAVDTGQIDGWRGRH
jgi:hypothetical protein